MFNKIETDDLTLSIRNGLYIPFLYKGRQVVVHNAAWSFREKIWIDDVLVVNQLGVSMTSTHEIEVAGDRLVITFGYRKRMSEVFLEASVDDRIVHEVHQRFGKEVKATTLVLFAIAGAAVGYGLGYLVGTLIGGA